MNQMQIELKALYQNANLGKPLTPSQEYMIHSMTGQTEEACKAIYQKELERETSPNPNPANPMPTSYGDPQAIADLKKGGYAVTQHEDGGCSVETPTIRAFHNRIYGIKAD